MSDFATLHGLLDRGAAKCYGRALSSVRMTPETVRAAVEKARPLTVQEIRRTAARSIPKGSTGRGGLGSAAIDAMYADYVSGNSLAKMGKIYGRTRQAMFDLFKRHNKPLRSRKFFGAVEYRGRLFTPGKDGYLRATSGDRAPLHYIIWQETKGAVPPGHVLTFRDGNRSNVTIANLECAPKPVVMKKTRNGHNQFTPAAQRSRHPVRKPKWEQSGIVEETIRVADDKATARIQALRAHAAWLLSPGRTTGPGRSEAEEAAAAANVEADRLTKTK